MASNSFFLEVVTPEKKLFSGEAEIVIVRTKTGYEGFMARHAWACKLLGVGEMLIKEADSAEYKIAATANGFIDVKDSVTVFTEAAEWQEDIDADRAQAAKEIAEHWFEAHASDESDEAGEEVKFALAKAVNRIKIKEGGYLGKK